MVLGRRCIASRDCDAHGSHKLNIYGVCDSLSRLVSQNDTDDQRDAGEEAGLLCDKVSLRPHSVDGKHDEGVFESFPELPTALTRVDSLSIYETRDLQERRRQRHRHSQKANPPTQTQSPTTPRTLPPPLPNCPLHPSNHPLQPNPPLTMLLQPPLHPLPHPLHPAQNRHPPPLLLLQTRQRI